MKIKIVLCLILLLIFFTFGCNKQKTDEEILKEFISTLNIPSELNENLDLKNTYQYEGKEIKASWVSSNERILTNDGKYYLNKKGDLITLDLTLSLNSNEVTESFMIVCNASSEEDILNEAIKLFNFPSQISGSIELENTIRYSSSTIQASYESKNKSIIENDGTIHYSLEDRETSFVITFKYNSAIKTENFDIKVNAINTDDFNKELSCLIIKETDIDIDLPTYINYNGSNINLTYESSNKEVLENNGKVIPSQNKETVTLTITSDFGYSTSFDITILSISDDVSISKAFEDIYIPNIVTSDIILDENLNYGVQAKWESSNKDVLTNDGKLLKSDKYYDITLSLTLSKGQSTMTETFDIKACKEEHMFIDRTFEDEKSNTHIENGKLVLDDNKIEGYYLTKEISTRNFTGCVGSVAAITSKTCTVELMISVYTNEKWSKFFSYQAWGKGLKNAGKDQTDTYFEMNDDEIKAKNSNFATKFKIKLILRRNNTNVDSPIVSLVALTLYFDNYETNAGDILTFPKEVKYDVPKLRQADVPSIGGSICSITTSTMLLKYKGHDFSNITKENSEAPDDIPDYAYQYEHGYMAYILRDYGNNIFGNWVYNTIGISSFGEIAYLKRFYSYSEFMYYLDHVGPMGVSIKGDVVNNVKTYHTNGHLMVCTGYRINSDNSIVFYINDPNVSTVSVEMTYEAFKNVWRMFAYVVE